jgi:hypothetical protein
VSRCPHHWTVTSECPKCLRAELDEARRHFVLVAEAFGLVSTDDTGRIGQVATVDEVVTHARECASALSKWEEAQESLLMACEEPRTNCECPGCSYAREKDGAHND